MGKSKIVFYSWVGNTAAVANEIQIQTGFDIERIEDKKELKKSNIIGASMGAFFGFKRRINPMEFDLAGYDQILLGAQVWAGRTTPSINTYLQKASFTDKKVWLFITHADNKMPKDIIDSISKRIEKKGGKVVDSISFTTIMTAVNLPANYKDDLRGWLIKNCLIS